MTTFVVFSCDKKYFPLAKGLVLSLANQGLEQNGICLAFIDIGCTPESLLWLRSRGVTILPASDVRAIDGLQLVNGYHLAQACRPFLPRLFPAADGFIWLDSDLWVQSANVIKLLATYSSQIRGKIFVCPEWHYTYTINNDIVRLHVEAVRAHYAMAYGEQAAETLSARPTLNTGVFAMAAECPLWEMWAQEVKALFARDYGPHNGLMYHLADQLALNYLADRTGNAIPVDPMFNFICMLALPFRDESGVVRAPLPPYNMVGIVHLVMWSVRRKYYMDGGLLFDRGNYLTDEEQRSLMA